MGSNENMKPAARKKVLFITDHLNKHIQENVPFDEEGVSRNFMEAAIMAKESYRLMDPPGEELQYDDAPQFLKNFGVSDKTKTVGEQMVKKDCDIAQPTRWDNVRKRQ